MSIVPATLSPDEEQSLVARHKAGDRAAGEVLVRLHERLIAWSTRRFRNKGLDLEDLRQEARMALLAAAMDHDGQARLATYAAKRILWQLADAIPEQGLTVFVPGATYRRTWRKGRSPAWARPALSLDLPAFADGDETRGNLLQSEDPSAEENVIDRDLARAAHGALHGLEEREAYVLGRLYLKDEPTLQALGDEIGLTRARIQQIRDEALEKLRTRIEARPFRQAR